MVATIINLHYNYTTSCGDYSIGFLKKCLSVVKSSCLTNNSCTFNN